MALSQYLLATEVSQVFNMMMSKDPPVMFV